MFGDVVVGVDAHLFENALQRLKLASGVGADVELDADDLRELVGEFRDDLRGARPGEEFPQDPQEQLARVDRGRVQVVEHAARPHLPREYHIADDLGTAVNVADGVRQHGRRLGTGVAFTRNPRPASTSCTASS